VSSQRKINVGKTERKVDLAKKKISKKNSVRSMKSLTKCGNLIFSVSAVTSSHFFPNPHKQNESSVSLAMG